jgi:hypothetical protein
MLKADRNLRRVADWGSDPAGSISEDRRQEYLSLLRRVGSTIAYRSNGEKLDMDVLVWGWGWGSHTRHIDVSWMDEVPINRVTNLDRCRAPALYGNRQYFSRHIEGNWYLDTDMRP